MHRNTPPHALCVSSQQQTTTAKPVLPATLGVASNISCGQHPQSGSYRKSESTHAYELRTGWMCISLHRDANAHQKPLSAVARRHSIVSPLFDAHICCVANNPTRIGLFAIPQSHSTTYNCVRFGSPLRIDLSYHSSGEALFACSRIV